MNKNMSNIFKNKDKEENDVKTNALKMCEQVQKYVEAAETDDEEFLHRLVECSASFVLTMVDVWQPDACNAIVEICDIIKLFTLEAYTKYITETSDKVAAANSIAALNKLYKELGFSDEEIKKNN